MIQLRATMPYIHVLSPNPARDDIVKLLSACGCTSVDVINDNDDVVLVFDYEGETLRLRVSISGWCRLFLSQSPRTSRMRVTQSEYSNRVLSQARIAIVSCLRDWVKAQLKAVECGIFPFEKAFRPYAEGS